MSVPIACLKVMILTGILHLELPESQSTIVGIFNRPCPGRAGISVLGVGEVKLLQPRQQRMCITWLVNSLALLLKSAWPVVFPGV